MSDDLLTPDSSSLQNRRDFCVFKGTGAKARRARSASCVRGEVHSRSPRARLAFASVRLKYAKNHACSAG